MARGYVGRAIHIEGRMKGLGDNGYLSSRFRSLSVGLVATGLVCGFELAPAQAAGSTLSTEPIPMKAEEDLPERTPPIIEIGPDFLGTGNIPEGIELPTGAVWTPALWIFGNYRTAINFFDNGADPEVLEWANRLDLFANLQLSGTERLLLGSEPITPPASGASALGLWLVWVENQHCAFPHSLRSLREHHVDRRPNVHRLLCCDK